MTSPESSCSLSQRKELTNQASSVSIFMMPLPECQRAFSVGPPGFAGRKLVSSPGASKWVRTLPFQTREITRGLLEMQNLLEMRDFRPSPDVLIL